MASKKKVSKKKVSKKTASNAPAKTDETKVAKFKELASKRTTKAINAIRSLQKLSNRGNYAYTDEQVNKICEALKKETVALHDVFTRKSGAAKETFTV